jgi:hypothetical protein
LVIVVCAAWSASAGFPQARHPVEDRASVGGLRAEEPARETAFSSFSHLGRVFYLDLPKPARFFLDAQEMKGFLNCDDQTKVMISRSSNRKELVDALGTNVSVEPTLKEEMYPWEEKEPYEAWIIHSKVR